MPSRRLPLEDQAGAAEEHQSKIGAACHDLFGSIYLRIPRCVASLLLPFPPTAGRQLSTSPLTFDAARALVVNDERETGNRDRQAVRSHWPISVKVPVLGKPAMEFTDRVLKCIDCGAEFVFTAGEQVFFHDKQFKNDPKRCKQCKAKRVRGGQRVRPETRTTCSECGDGDHGSLQAHPGQAGAVPLLLPETG